MNALNELMDLGYNISLDGEIIRFKYIRDDKPDKERVAFLIQEVKKGKAIAIKALKQRISVEILDDLLFSSIRKTKKKYNNNVIIHVRKNNKDISNEITEVSKKVSVLYKKCRIGTATLAEFKHILEHYQNIRIKAIYSYKNKESLSTLTVY